MGRIAVIMKSCTKEELKGRFERVKESLIEGWKPHLKPGGRMEIRGRYDVLTEKGYNTLLQDPLISKIESCEVDGEVVNFSYFHSGHRAEQHRGLPDGEHAYALVRVENHQLFSAGSQSIFWDVLAALKKKQPLVFDYTAWHVGWQPLCDSGIPPKTEFETLDGILYMRNVTLEELYGPHGREVRMPPKPEKLLEFFEIPKKAHV